MHGIATLLVTFLLTPAARPHGPLHEQIALLTARLEEEPCALLHLERGELHRLHEDWARAANDYERAAQLDPALPAVDLARGRMLLEAGRPVQALAPLDRYVTRVPEDGRGWVTRARVRASLGRGVEAALDFTRAIARVPRPGPELYLERARALRGEPCRSPALLERALESLEEGIEHLGPLVVLDLEALELECSLERYEAALRRLDAMARRVLRPDGWQVRRGEILLVAGRIEPARAAFGEALRNLESLPESRRRVPAVRRLQALVIARLQELEAGS